MIDRSSSCPHTPLGNPHRALRPLHNALLLLTLIAAAMVAPARAAMPPRASVAPSADMPTLDRQASAIAPAGRIPDVHTTSLTGQSVDLPAQLHTRQAAVLILGFTKDARGEVRDWGRRLAADYAGSPTVLFYEMPVLASVPRLLRPWVLRQIAAEVSDHGKPHFAPITDHEPQWRALAQVNDPNSAYVLLLNRDGDVVSTRSGAPTDTAYSSLRRELQALPPNARTGGAP